MRKAKITSIILGLGMVGAIGVSVAPAHSTTGQVQNVKLLSNSEATGYGCVVNGNDNLVLTNAKGDTTGYISTGQMLIVKGHSNGKTLVTVEETGSTGYISNDNIQMIQSGTSQSMTKMNRKGYIVNVSTRVHVRANATMDSSVLANLTEGTNLTITGHQGNWYRVNVNGIKGYVYGEYVAQGATAQGGTVSVINPTTTTTNNGNKVVNEPTTVVSTTKTVKRVVVPSSTTTAHATAVATNGGQANANANSSNGEKTTATANANGGQANANANNGGHASATSTTPVVKKNTTTTTTSKTGDTTAHASATSTTPVVKKNTTATTTSKTGDTTAHASATSTTPVVKHDTTTPVKHDTTPVVKHDTTTPVKHDTTPVVKHDTTTPVVKHDTTTPVKHDTTTPVKHDTTTPVKHDTTPVVKHDTTTPTSKTGDTTPAKKTITPANNEVQIGSPQFYNIINNELLTLTNQYRQQHGEQPLQSNSVLINMANWKANNCTELNYFSDYTPSGKTVLQMPQFQNVTYSHYAENLAGYDLGKASGNYSATSTKYFAKYLFQELINSPAHRANILQANLTEIGIQTSISHTGMVVSAQEFGTNVAQ